jgi:hypothetical protein
MSGWGIEKVDFFLLTHKGKESDQGQYKPLQAKKNSWHYGGSF